MLEEGEPDQFLIKMNNQWVPVRETPIVGHGVRYDAKIGEELFPVNFNGMEWYFEAKTSPLWQRKSVQASENNLRSSKLDKIQ
ncbi:hypothetical protein QUB72_00510 [Enterococcus faecium]|nr:hypothetical protein [Enterococcus faecium]